LRQLAQRVTGRYHLKPLSREETKGYVRHRLRVAGAQEEIFTSRALDEVHRLSAGIPRVINVACDRALLGAYTQETRKINAALVRQAAGEVYGRSFVPGWTRWLAGTLGTALLLACGLLSWQLWSKHSSSNPAEASRAELAAGHSSSAADSAAVPAAVPHPVAAAGIAVTGTPAAANSAASADTASANTGSANTASATPPSGPTPHVPAADTTHAQTPSVDLEALLESSSAATTETAAFRRLLALWGTAMSDDRDPCGQALKAGLSCLEQRGSWAQVRALNRPAILTLEDKRGVRHRVVLSGLDDAFATLDLGESHQRVALEDLSRDWFGDFTVVWKPKTTHTRSLSLGMQGDEVRWLRRSLNALRGGASDPEHADVYDEQLAAAVQNFQREHRLNVDGIAGLQTQVVLDTALAEPGSPLLLTNASRGG
jgi:general secretion pathway protein A